VKYLDFFSPYFMLCRTLSPQHGCRWRRQPPGWREVANIFNKQSQTANKGVVLHAAWEFGKELTNPQHKKQLVTKCFTWPQKWILWNDLGSGKWI